MGNSLGGRKKMAKVMKVDGSTFKVKPPAQAAGVLRDYPAHALLNAEKVHRLGLRARPLDPDAPLKPGKLYFLVELRPPRHRAGSGGNRRAWSGELGQSGARERLESLRLSRRSASDASSRTGSAWAPATVTGAKDDGTLRIKMRLPKAQVEKLMEETAGDAAEVAHRIMQLCAVEDIDGAAARRPTLLSAPPPAAPSSLSAGRKEKRTRFLATPQEIIV